MVRGTALAISLLTLSACVGSADTNGSGEETTDADPLTTGVKAPTDLHVVGTTSTTVTFKWKASSSPSGIAHYNTYRDGKKTTTTTALEHTFTKLSCGVTHSFGVAAVDNKGRVSPITTASGKAPCPQLDWIFIESALQAVHDLDDALANHFFDNSGTFTNTGNNPVYPANTPTKGYSSYAQLLDDLATGAIDPQVKVLKYDNESWTLTPPLERQHPKSYMDAFTKTAHAHGYGAMLTPAVDLVFVAGADCTRKPGEAATDAYTRCDFAGIVAESGADIYEIQAQSVQASPSTYQSFVAANTARARSLNPEMPILAGVTTMRAEDTADNMFQSAIAVASGQPSTPQVDGFWLNVASSDPNQVSMAIQFLTMLRSAHY